MSKLMESVRDLKLAARSLRRSPGFSFAVVLTLAIGIAGNTVFFSLVDAVLLRPLVYPDSGRLVVLSYALANSPEAHAPVNVPDFQEWQRTAKSFEAMAITRPQAMSLQAGEAPVRVGGARVSPELLRVLGMEAQLGQSFRPGDDSPAAAPVAVISHGLWQQQFGGSRDVVGRVVSLDGIAYTVLGVLPPQARFPNNDTDIWIPFVPRARELARGLNFVRSVARLKPGVSLEDATAEMAVINAGIEKANPGTMQGSTVRVTALQEIMTEAVRAPLIALWAAVGFVLLIACVNIATLLLARSASRQSEFALRSALGASRWRLALQTLSEAVLLSLAGGAVALLSAAWLLPVLSQALRGQLPRADEVALNPAVALFTFALAMVVGLLFGGPPALYWSKQTGSEVVRGGRGSGRTLSRRTLKSLAIAEIAVAFSLLVGAGLMLRSFARATQVPLGFNPYGVVGFQVDLSPARYPNKTEQARFYERAVQQLSALPAVEAAAGVSRIPMLGGNQSTTYNLEDRPLPLTEWPWADARLAAPDFFRVFQTPVIAGREFILRDTADSPAVVVVNRQFAERYWKNQDPVGKRMQLFPDTKTWREIVGVVEDIKLKGVEMETVPTVYVPYSQSPFADASRSGFLVVRSGASAAALHEDVRSAVLTVDGLQAVSAPIQVQDVVRGALAQRRLTTLLLIGFAAVASLLVVVGIYALMAFMVTNRRHEIGTRMALGARPGQVFQMVIGEAMWLGVAGCALGIGLAWALRGAIARLLFATDNLDPRAYGIAIATIFMVSVVAAYLPAWGAARVEPATALRSE